MHIRRTRTGWRLAACALLWLALAGCDAVLLCNQPPDEQVAALEAVIKAVEAKRVPMARIRYMPIA